MTSASYFEYEVSNVILIMLVPRFSALGVPLLAAALVFTRTGALSVPCSQISQVSRRELVVGSAAVAAAAVLTEPKWAEAAIGGQGLAAKLSQRDPAALRNSIFNVPPSAQIYPNFLRGEWEVTSKFSGFLFPSKTVPKAKIIADVTIPGFQKCSIAAICDVGKEETRYTMRIDSVTGLEDRPITLASQIDANLGYKAVKDVPYDGAANPNRISVTFVPNRTRNAERIELFCNARESELVMSPADETLGIFVCSEYVRQVTFSLSQEFGVARQVVGNYSHFWTWRESRDRDRLTGNVLTAVYLDPQSPLFFDEPSKPVVVYSHELTAQRSA